MGKLGVLLAVLAVIVSLYWAGLLTTDSSLPPLPADGWWGRGPKQTTEDTAVREFKVQVPDATLNDLKQRLSNARMGEDLENTSFEYGFQVNYMKEVLDHWKTKYDWRKQEAIINSFPQYKTKIEGIDVHFFRVKPASKGTLLSQL